MHFIQVDTSWAPEPWAGPPSPSATYDEAAGQAADQPVGCAAFYAAICKECENVGWPKCHHSDVFRWDRQYKGDPCIWVLRDMGSNLLPIQFKSEYDLSCWIGHDSFGWYAHMHAPGHVLHYHWDGIRLRPISPEDAIRLAQEGAAWSRLQPDFKRRGR